jgi:hypothetical protein
LPIHRYRQDKVSSSVQDHILPFQDSTTRIYQEIFHKTKKFIAEEVFMGVEKRLRQGVPPDN